MVSEIVTGTAQLIENYYGRLLLNSLSDFGFLTKHIYLQTI